MQSELDRWMSAGRNLSAVHKQYRSRRHQVVEDVQWYSNIYQTISAEHLQLVAQWKEALPENDTLSKEL